MELREKLLALKTENGLTTDALSERSGVPKGTINKLLNGETRNPTTQTLRRLAKALNCPLEALCGQPTDIPGVYRLGALTGEYIGTEAPVVSTGDSATSAHGTV